MASTAPSLRNHLVSATMMPMVGDWHQVRCEDFEGMRLMTVARVVEVCRKCNVVEVELTPTDTWRVAQVRKLLARHVAKVHRRVLTTDTPQLTLL